MEELLPEPAWRSIAWVRDVDCGAMEVFCSNPPQKKRMWRTELTNGLSALAFTQGHSQPKIATARTPVLSLSHLAQVLPNGGTHCHSQDILRTVLVRGSLYPIPPLFLFKASLWSGGFPSYLHNNCMLDPLHNKSLLHLPFCF